MVESASFKQALNGLMLPHLMLFFSLEAIDDCEIRDLRCIMIILGVPKEIKVSY
jgi:hypothetical protein